MLNKANILYASRTYFLLKILLLGSIITALILNIFAPTQIQAAAYKETGIATSTTLLWMNESQLNSRLQDIKNLGATWIRVDFNWSEIQPDNYDDYKWGPYDRVVKAAQKYDLKILAMLGYTPPWARNPRCALLHPQEETGQKCSPRNTVEFGRFARAAVIRYRDKGIHTWEIWNEPNLIGYWKTVRTDNVVSVDPEAYARTANAAALEIRNHQSGAYIITGGLSPMFDTMNPKGMRQSDFLKRLLPNLNHSLFDAVAIHPYSWPKMPILPAEYNAFYTADKGRPQYNLRKVMLNAGWGDKHLWATEFGASTKGQRDVNTPLKVGRPDHVTEPMQAQIIQQGIDNWHKKPNAGPIFIHADSDQWLMTRKNEGGFGLRRVDGSKKPAYDAFQQSTLRLKISPQ